jgi:plastocyanin
MRFEDTLGVACAAVLMLAGVPAVARAEPQVEVRVFQFRPGRLETKAGTTVAWTNRDDITHTVTSGTPEARNGHFAQRLDGKGTTTTVEFSRPGAYPYFCERHPSMRGEIRVD